MKSLKNPSLVNESVTSEMNLSLKSSKLLQTSISKPSADKSSSRHNTTPSSDVTKFNKTAMELRLRNMFSSPKFKVEKEEAKTSEHQQSNILSKKYDLNRSKRAELSLLKMLTPQKPKLEQLDTTDIKKLNDTSINTSSKTTQSRKNRVLSMLTPRKAQPSRQAQTTGPDVAMSRNQENTKSVCAKTMKIEKTDPQCCETTPFSKVSPDLEHCKLSTGLPLNAMSPFKRNHIQLLDVTQEGSPSKRIRFHDKSVLSSTRIDDPGCGEADEVPHFNNTRSCSSRQRMYDNHQQYYRSSDTGPANGYYSTMQDPIVSHSGNCRGSCCQTHIPPYKVEYNHDPCIYQHSSNEHTMLGKCKHREPRQSVVLNDRNEQHSVVLPSRRITRQSIRRDRYLEDTKNIIDCKDEKENIPDSKQLTPANSAISKSAIEIPIVTQLLKGLNSNNKKLRINVAYDVTLAEDFIKTDKG